jgi:hypothetical protein
MKKLIVKKDNNGTCYIHNWDNSLVNKYIIIESEINDTRLLGKIINEYEFNMIFSFVFNSKLYKNIVSYYDVNEDIYLLTDREIKILKM